MVTLSLIVAYIVGGITFLPSVFLILYIVHKVSAIGTWTIQQAAYNGDPKYNTTETTTSSRSATTTGNGLSTHTKSSQLPQSLLQQQSYKVGWLRVSRDEQRLPPPDASIGDMVKNIIINGNRNNQQNQIYFAVLKHTTLYLYDSERQLDCKGVIQVNQHRVMTHPPGLHDHELFTRPHLIKLTHKDNKDAHYYINCNKCVDKEDWYFALLRSGYSLAAAESTHTSTATLNTTSPTGTRSTISHHEKESSMHFDQEAMNKLLTTIHSDEHHFQTQWFNAMLGRIFCAVYKTDEINAHLYNKLISKLDKINARRPAFLGEITVRSVDPGHAPPFITQPRLLGLSPTGELTAEAHMQYEGGIRFEIETVLKWKYSDHLRPLTVDLVLAITLKSLKGKFLLKIKEPPTNRFWYGFYELPQMEWLVEPLVWERRVGYSMVVKAIQTKIDELVMENVVLPNLDDITFFPTHGVGGIFGSPTSASSTTTLSPVPTKENHNNKAPLTTSASLPELFDKPSETTKPKMKRWFTSKDTVTATTTAEESTSDKEEEKEEEPAITNNTPPRSRPPAKMVTSFSDSAREQKSQRSFIDAILNRKPSQQQRLQREKQNNCKNSNNNDTSFSSITSSDIPNIPTVAIASSPCASSITSSSASSSTSDPTSGSDYNSSHNSSSGGNLSRPQEQYYTTSLSPSAFKHHTLPIPIITTEFEQYDDSDHNHDTTRARSSSLTNTSTISAATAAKEDHQRQLRLRKSASLARMKAKTMASTAVSQINVSPKMHKADELMNNASIHKMNQQNSNSNNNNICSDAATVISSVHQSVVLSSPIDKPVVSIA